MDCKQVEVVSYDGGEVLAGFSLIAPHISVENSGVRVADEAGREIFVAESRYHRFRQKYSPAERIPILPSAADLDAVVAEKEIGRRTAYQLTVCDELLADFHAHEVATNRRAVEVFSHEVIG